MEITENFDGIWLIDKPLGISSFAVVQRMRKLLGLKKVGHAGTLDPLATGLMIVCSGKFTKQIEGLMGMPKIYTGNFYLGAVTESYDLEQKPEFSGSTSHLNPDILCETASQMVGTQWQMPPIHSAIKVDGKRAYAGARKGLEVVLKPREITISQFELKNLELPEVGFLVACSKGTYIRSLAHDFGQKLKCGAYLSSLRRTAIGPFKIEDAHKLSDLENILKAW